jgi:Zn-dependent M28 family amino/carboxypeptidase
MELSRAFRETIKRSGLYVHCEMFQTIADVYGGIRASGSPGFVASMDYVLAKLVAAGYNVYTTDVIADYFDEVLPPKLEGAIEYTSPSSDPMTYYTYPGSASGTVEAPVYAVDVAYDPESEADTSTSGCETEDFDGFPAGSIALISRGTCSYNTKLDNAVAAGASGIILTNEGNSDRMDATGNRFRKNFPVPIIYGSSMLGMSILDALDASNMTSLKVSTDVIAEKRVNKNIIAETDSGDDSNTIMIGAHLDSVFEGPGIQDNTSGSSAALELALQFKKNGWDSEDFLENKIRFAWWASEEYVQNP